MSVPMFLVINMIISAVKLNILAFESVGIDSLLDINPQWLFKELHLHFLSPTNKISTDFFKCHLHTFWPKTPSILKHTNNMSQQRETQRYACYI